MHNHKSRYYGAFKVGNLNLYNNILISNLTSYKTCPSRLLGLCHIENIGKKCYAKKPEQQYKHCLEYRTKQENYWDSTNIIDIAYDIQCIIKRNKQLKYFRLNEVGDFENQFMIGKVSTLSYWLKRDYNIITYCYTCRSDLRFNDVHFIVKGTNFNCKDGFIKIIEKDELAQYESDKKWFVCRKAYKKICGLHCKACMSNKHKNIAIVYH